MSRCKIIEERGGPREGPWEVIDFLDIEKSQRGRLTDDFIWLAFWCASTLLAI